MFLSTKFYTPRVAPVFLYHSKTCNVWVVVNPDNAPIFEITALSLSTASDRVFVLSSAYLMAAVQSDAGPANRMRFSSGSETTKVLAPHGSVLSV